VVPITYFIEQPFASLDARLPAIEPAMDGLAAELAGGV
jgi:hypothetical protein